MYHIFMDWAISIIFFVLSNFFLLLGGMFRKNEWVFVGFTFMLILGIGILATGLSVPSGWFLA